jgi:hypothetical protein
LEKRTPSAGIDTFREETLAEPVEPIEYPEKLYSELWRLRMELEWIK